MADWNANTRPHLDMELSFTKGPSPYVGSAETDVFVHAQLLQGGEPWKTQGVEVMFCCDFAGKDMNKAAQTDENGIATVSYNPAAFQGYDFVTAAALPQDLTAQRLVVGKLMIE